MSLARLAAAASSPQHAARSPLVEEAPAEDLPVPPLPPDLPPLAQSAPIPNPDAQAPVTALQTARPGLRPDLYRPKSYNRGDGYLSGSGQYDEGRFKQGPSGGVRLDVPLQ